LQIPFSFFEHTFEDILTPNPLLSLTFANSLSILWTYILKHFGPKSVSIFSYLWKLAIQFLNKHSQTFLTPNPLVILTLQIHYFVFGKLHSQSFCQPIIKYLTFSYSFFKMYILKTFWHSLNYQSHTLQIPYSSLKHTFSNNLSPNSLPFETYIRKNFVTQLITIWNIHSQTFCHSTHYQIKSRLPTREYPPSIVAIIPQQ